MAELIQYQLIDSKLHPYNLQYPKIYQKIKDLITQLLPNLEIEHIGSTAIPSIYSKSIIDILIPCLQADFSYIISQLKNLGFQTTPFKNIPEDRPMLVAGINYKQKFYNIHLHLTPRNSEVHLDNIYFRDQLRQNPKLAKKYERIKKETVAAGKVEPTEYNLAKSPFIKSVLINRKKDSYQ